MSSSRRSRQRARTATLTKALPASVGQGNITSRPQAHAVGDLINQITARAEGGGVGPYRFMPEDPRNANPFGPMHPLRPAPLDDARPDTGRPEPRVLEYPVAWNIPGNDNRPVPWSVLRGAAQYIDIVRRCIEVRKRHIRSLKWTWGVRDQVIQDAYQSEYRRGKDNIAAELREKYLPEINRLTDFWRKPWRANGLSFGQWCNGILEEHLVLDAVPVYPRMTFGGDCVGLEIVDGSTIKPLLDWRGARPEPPYPAFQQIVYGFPRGEFTATTDTTPGGETVVPNGYLADQMFYHRENFRPGVPGYGYSAVEQALISARLYLKRQGWMLAEYDDGSTPLTWLTPDANAVVAGEDWNPRQRREWENSLNDELSGQTAARHRIKVAPPGMTPNMMPGIDERYKPEYDLYLLKLLATHFNVTLPELGFTEAKGLGSQGYHEGQEDVQDRIGRRPDVQILAELITDLSASFLHAPKELEFQFLGLESEDEAAQDQIGQNRVGSARIVLNEDRRRQGAPLYNFAEADMPMVITQRGIVFVEGASKLVPPGETIVPEQLPLAPPGQTAGGGDAETQPRPGPKPPTMTKAAGPDAAVAERVYQQLLEDYPPEVLQWVRAAHWQGPVGVPLDQVDYSKANTWEASHEAGKVARFRQQVRAGTVKPAVLVKEPHNPAHIVVDGHHRALAAREEGQPLPAFVATVGNASGPWDEMHDRQYRHGGTGAEPKSAPPAPAGDVEKAAAEAAAYRRWARRNPNARREFQFLHHTVEEAALLKAAGDSSDGGGADPKDPDTRWPGWSIDLALAAYWANRLRRALTGALGIDSVVRAVLAAFPRLRRGDVHRPSRAWLATQDFSLDGPIRDVVTGILTDGYLVGDRAAAAVITGGLGADIDWSGWKPGNTAAARQILSADGQDVGLRHLLNTAGVSIKSIADGRLDEVAAVLADGLEEGHSPAQIATALRGVLDDPAWAEMVAVTETARAQSAAAHARYAANEIEATRWLTTTDQRVCPVCKGNADAGPVPLGHRFPSGDLYPPAHPRCRCAPVPVVTRS